MKVLLDILIAGVVLQSTLADSNFWTSTETPEEFKQDPSPNASFPIVRVLDVKFFTEKHYSETKTYSQHEADIKIPAYFYEIVFRCDATYHIRWTLSKNPWTDDNLKDIPQVQKWQFVLKNGSSNCNSTNCLKNSVLNISSTLTIRFKKALQIPTITCESLIYKNLSIIVRSTRPFDNESDSFNMTIRMNPNDQEKKKRKERFGENKHCNISLHADDTDNQIRFLCQSSSADGQLSTNSWTKNWRDNVRSQIIQCNNEDECSFVARNETKNCTQDNIKTLNLICKDNKKCLRFQPTGHPGIILCEDESNNQTLAIKYHSGFKTTKDGKRSNRKYYLDRNFDQIIVKDFIVSSPISTNTNEKSYIAFDQEKHTFSCTVSMAYFSRGIIWVLLTQLTLVGDQFHQCPHCPAIIYDNATETVNDTNHEYESRIDITFNMSFGSNQTLYCYVPPWNSKFDNGTWVISPGWRVIVHKVSPPIFVSQEKTVNESLAKYICTFSGEPLRFKWTNGGIDGSNITVGNQEYGTSSNHISWTHLTIKIDDFNDTNIFTCVAYNFLGQTDEYTFPNVSHETKKSSVYIWTAAVGVGAVTIISVVIILGIFKHRQNKEYSNYEELIALAIDEFEKGVSDANNDNVEPYLILPYDYSFEIPLDRLKLGYGVLGSGQFGSVSKAMLDAKEVVAVKTIKKSAHLLYFKSLLSELKILCHLGSHPHILQFIGASTENIRKKDVLIIFEYCPKGDLLNYLRTSRTNFVNYYEEDTWRQSLVNYSNATAKFISTKDLLRWGIQIANAMEFLSLRKIVHGDLAARNILLTEKLAAKVSDFGLSKQFIENYSIYVQKLEKPLPLRWMAIESLCDLEFSLESDTWTYGVALWEIFSLGQIPYPGIDWSFDSWNLLRGGYRMQIPQFANLPIYNVMVSCWNSDPKQRIGFTKIQAALQKELTKLFGR